MLRDVQISILLIDGDHKDCEYYAHRLKLSSPDFDVVQAETGRAGLASPVSNAVWAGPLNI